MQPLAALNSECGTCVDIVIIRFCRTMSGKPLIEYLCVSSEYYSAVVVFVKYMCKYIEDERLNIHVLGVL